MLSPPRSVIPCPDLPNASPVGQSDIVAIRHTSVVNPSRGVYSEVRSDLEKAGLTLTQLLKINNPDLLERFQLESEQLKKLKQKNKDFQLNIQNLYHGTTASLEQLCDEGLDERLSRRGRFGRGIYLSDNPAKCCKYAGTRSREPYLLRCQVILGDIKEFLPGEQDPTLTREPMKTIVDGKRVYYDSVKGHPADHTEYVVYEKRRVLLEYIAFYSSPNLLKMTQLSQAESVEESELAESKTPPRAGSCSPQRFLPGSCSGSSRESSPIRDGSSMESDPGSSPETPEPLPKFKCRRRAENQLPSNISDSAAAAAAVSPSCAFGTSSVSASAQEQQRMAFQQLLQLKGKISEEDMNDLISSWTTTYGSVAMPNQLGEADEMIPVIDIEEGDEDDPVSLVKQGLVMDFKDITCCEDEALCLQYIDNYNMDLNAAIQAYFGSESDK